MKGILKKISKIEFGLLSPDEIRKMSVAQIITPDTYDEDGYPIENGLMDRRLGVIDPGLKCKTCGAKGGDCPGHFGHINFARPVIHVGFADTIHKILRSTCRKCGRILLDDNEIEEYTSLFQEAMEREENLTDIIKEVYDVARRERCPHCDEDQGDIKIDKPVSIVEEDYKLTTDEIIELIEDIIEMLGEGHTLTSPELTELLERKYRLTTTEIKRLTAELDENLEEIIEYIEEVKSFRRVFEKTGKKSTFNEIIEFLENESPEEVSNNQATEWINFKEKTKILEEFDKTLKDEPEVGERIRRLLEIVRKVQESPEKISEIKGELKEIIRPLEVLEKIRSFRKLLDMIDYKLTPSEVREWLEKVTDQDSLLLGVNPEVARPEWMVLTVLPVPPVTVRPSITLETGERSEDDLTHKLVDILRINQRLKENMEAGAPQLIIEDLWELLQYHVTTYFDNEASGVPPARHRSGRPLKTLAQRLKGKEGRFRGNLSGKRVNFSARTVISPDPNISINEVGVPEIIAKEVTVPVYVTEWNIDEVKKYIKNGPDKHPGANYVIRPDNRKIRIYEETKEAILEKIEPGYIVERHLKDGDIVLFNRQPSLHRMSMMAHEVRVLPYKTFRLNLCVCPPYNADFDGDEMNLHVLQTEEARAEAKTLMRVQEHILSPRFGGPIIGGIHDHISGAYLLTRKGTEFDEGDAFQLLKRAGIPLPDRKGRKWTGKEIFSMVLPDDLNMTYKAEICRKCDECLKEECKYDAYVIIENGQLKSGVIDEKAYGAFSGKILDHIVKEYDTDKAREFLDTATKLAIAAIMKVGFTTSIRDQEIPKEAKERIEAHLKNAEKRVDRLIEAYENGELEPLPGRTLEETLEMKIMQVLGEARDKSGEIAEEYFDMEENHAVIMALTGARGSMLNLTQITACVGQQSVRGSRITRGYNKRTLPHFKKGELGAKARGFVHSSYKEGLDPLEFFFHAMGGREGLVDTAIRTAQSGYMQRRLVNALQDLTVTDDGMVIDNRGIVIQRLYGEDGVDPAKSDYGEIVDLEKLVDEIRAGK
ncbi:DNA-directed RNA polymerase subunit A' [Methanothermobacter tenebrarum]|uniref:DNA-directed RNA polymerase subunit Rpo1N n=1 Tax=Methanothermobacter tenebrarum TaxID=680118 RepID=A0A328P9L7_9EURY|nr:DNA-directed RNA polymerase subunit A' [Methanothermobacter tenebrarum]NPV65055.1 DNA-directed RNA polymerase subunit A' [Methanobacteriaceae archaeon]RAO79267.1 DNA-directed RNA polymerase subunit A' [Methanothermobacter tenebrarum]